MKRSLILFVGLIFTIAYAQEPQRRDLSAKAAVRAALGLKIHQLYEHQDREAQLILDERLKGIPSPEPHEFILRLKGENHPQLIAPDLALKSLLLVIKTDRPASWGKNELLKLGFPLKEYPKVVEALEGAYDYESFISSFLAPLLEKHDAAINPTKEVSDRDILRFFELYLVQQRKARETWLGDFLSLFSEQAQRVLWHYVTEVGNHHTHQSRYFGDPTNYIAYFRFERAFRLSRVHWRNEGGERSIIPPEMQNVDQNQCLWLNADEIQIFGGETGLTRSGKKVNDDTYGRRYVNFISTIPRRLDQLKKYAVDESPGCKQLKGHWPGFDVDYEGLFEMSYGIFEAEIIQVTNGFESGQPKSLLTLRVKDWIRKPFSGDSDIYYLIYYNTRFDIEGLTFCSNNDLFFPNPRKGKKLLVFVTAESRDDTGALLKLPPWAVFAEDDVEHKQNRSDWLGFLKQARARTVQAPFDLRVIPEIVR